MSTELIEKEIARFLSSPNPEVLCFRGKWGIGKTFSWNAFIATAARASKVAASSYSYVSLFGIDSLDQLKYSIFESSISTKNIDVLPSLETLRSNTIAVANALGRKSLATILQSLPGTKNAAASLQSLAFLSVKNSLVCIDDLERKGSHLSTRDVLGLISHLKEQKACKVVLILNEEELLEADKEEFDKYNEKVVDISLLFAPSPEDCARIALSSQSDIHKKLATNCVALNVSNIRIIKKIERLVLRVQEMVKAFDPQVLHQAVQSLALLGWAHFGRESDLLDYITKKRGKDIFGIGQGDLPVEERTLSALLDEYGFASLDEFDAVLLEGIRNGFFDETRLNGEASKLGKKFKAIKTEESFEAAWRLYHDSFEDNEAAVANTIYESFKKSIQFVTPTNLNGTVRILKELGYEKKAQDALRLYMEERNEDRGFFDLKEHPFAENITDEDVKAAFDKKYSSFKDERNPADVLYRIAKEHGWSRNDIALLTKLSADDFFKIFKASAGDNLSRVVRASLDFGKADSADADMISICARATEALVKIGKESKINRRRVKKYGIDIDN